MSTETGPPATVGGRYTVGDLIGRGGAADVFRARDELLGRDVAIKMFNAAGSVVAENASPGDPADPAEKIGDIEEGQEARHRREVLTLAGLSHPGLVTVYDVGDEDGRAYFVMQLIEGDTLAQRIRTRPAAARRRRRAGRRARRRAGLRAPPRGGAPRRQARQRAARRGGPRRTSRTSGSPPSTTPRTVTAAGMVIGTASYLSARAGPRRADRRRRRHLRARPGALECLTGRREYPGNALEAAVARLHRRPVVPPDLPPGLEVLLTAMTADEPGDRPTTEEIVAALRGVSREVGMEAETVLSPVLMSAPTGVVGTPAMAVGPATEARAPELEATGASPLARPGRRRRRVAAVVAAAAATLLVAGSAVAYAVLSDDQPLPPVPSATLAPPPPPLPVVPQVTTTTRGRDRGGHRAAHPAHHHHPAPDDHHHDHDDHHDGRASPGDRPAAGGRGTAGGHDHDDDPAAPPALSGC